MTTNVVAEAAVTTALTGPKYTALSAALVLKPAPLILRFVPTGAASGTNEVITGGCAKRFSGYDNSMQKKKKSGKSVNPFMIRCFG